MAARLAAAARLMGGDPLAVDWSALRFEHVTALRSRLSELGRAPALPQMLSATLALEERSPGTLPLQTMLFLSPLFFRETTPAALSLRFLALVLRNTRPDSPELRAGARAFAPAAQLLRDALPRMQKLAPEMFAAAAAQLAALSPYAPDDSLSERLRNSSDPLGDLVDAAGKAPDERLKNELLGAAARLAREQGKLRQAAELIADVVEDRRGLPEGYSGRDELLEGIVRDSLKKKDLEVARYAASKIELPAYHASALGGVARYLHREKNAQDASETLGEAAKILDRAPSGKDRAVSYFRLVNDCLEVDDAKAFELAREAVKAANAVSLPSDDPGGEAAWGFFPLTDAAAESFARLAQKDRANALGLAAGLSLRELKIVALLSAYTSQADQHPSQPTVASEAQP